MRVKMSDNDLHLLARYTRQNAEDAFAEIVRRHLDLVFSDALCPVWATRPRLVTFQVLRLTEPLPTG
jgi:hypothetical protein